MQKGWEGQWAGSVSLGRPLADHTKTCSPECLGLPMASLYIALMMLFIPFPFAHLFRVGARQQDPVGTEHFPQGEVRVAPCLMPRTHHAAHSISVVTAIPTHSDAVGLHRRPVRPSLATQATNTADRLDSDHARLLFGEGPDQRGVACDCRQGAASLRLGWVVRLESSRSRQVFNSVRYVS